MLLRIINIINSSEVEIDSGTLFCNNYTVTDIECLEYIEDNNLIEEPLTSKGLNEVIDIGFSLLYMNGIGFYEEFHFFLMKNRYIEPQADYYLYDLKINNSSNNLILDSYRVILNFINSLFSIAKHVFEEVDIKCAIITIEEKSIVIQVIYDKSSLEEIHLILDELNDTISVFESNRFPDKKKLFMSELVSFLTHVEEKKRFSHLLLNFKDYYNKSINSYEFYLRDFSFNKLKIEIDTKALEFNQKIQGVINDSQTKLVAIPTAFILVYSTFDFDNISAIKNIAILIGTFVFAVIIQLFLNNQFSVLKFINSNMNAYKETFTKSNTALFVEKFELTYCELKKQKQRLKVVEVLLWAIPSVLLVIWITMICNCSKFN